MYNTFIRRRRGRLSRSDVDPAAPLDALRAEAAVAAVFRSFACELWFAVVLSFTEYD